MIWNRGGLYADAVSNCAGYGKKNYCMYYINYGNFDCGQDRSGQLSPKRRRNMPQSNPVRTVLFTHPFVVLCRQSGELTFAFAPPTQAIDTSLPPAGLIADSVKRSSRAHLFHFYTLLSEIASVPRKAPSAWITADRLVAASGGPGGSKGEKGAAAGGQIHPGARHVGWWWWCVGLGHWQPSCFVRREGIGEGVLEGGGAGAGRATMIAKGFFFPPLAVQHDVI
jgi:hypothetical protein